MAEPTFREIDDSLYYHERAFYSACARGTHFERTRQWDIERQWLTEQRERLRPKGKGK